MSLPNIEPHYHNGIDSLRVKADDLENVYDGSTAVKLTGDQTIAGIKTFSSIPVLPASNPTTDNQAVRKAYVDARFAATVNIASDNARDSADTQRNVAETSYTKYKEIKFNDVGGVIRTKIRFRRDTSGTAYGKVYINGSPVGVERTEVAGNFTTYTEDFTVATGDLIQLYLHAEAGHNVQVESLILCYDKTFSITAGTVNLN